MSFDVAWVRSQFPALKRHHNGYPVIYLDGPGGTQIPERVADRVHDHLLNHFSNVHGVFPTSQETDAVLVEARQAYAALFGCTWDEVSFGQNTTSLFFSLAWAISRDIQPGDEVLVTDVDHEANRGPWAMLAERGAIVKSVALDKKTMSIDHSDFKNKLSPKTKVVAINFASNAIGTINDVKMLVSQAKAVGAYTIIDAVHATLHVPLDVKNIACDFLGCSTYKFYGPHLGVLYARKEVMEKLQTCTLVTQEQQAPYKIEMGTLNHEGIAGAAEAVYFLADIGRHHASEYADKGQGYSGLRRDLVMAWHAMIDYEDGLCHQLFAGLKEIPGITIWGRPMGMPRTSTVAITVEGLHATEVAKKLADKGIFVTAGHFYAQRLIEVLGLADVGGVVRLGLVHFHTNEDIDRILGAIREIAGRG